MRARIKFTVYGKYNVYSVLPSPLPLPLIYLLFLFIKSGVSIKLLIFLIPGQPRAPRSQWFPEQQILAPDPKVKKLVANLEGLEMEIRENKNKRSISIKALIWIFWTVTDWDCGRRTVGNFVRQECCVREQEQQRTLIQQLTNPSQPSPEPVIKDALELARITVSRS